MKKFLKLLFKYNFKLFKFVKPLIKGTYYLFYYRIFKKNVIIKFPFLAHGPVCIQGPGKVYIGKYSVVFMNVYEGLNIVTTNKSAVVRIGDHCNIGGLNIRCHKEIIIGDNLLSANCIIQDSIFFYPKEVKSNNINRNINLIRPINIARNVWLGGKVYVLQGSKLDNDSVLSTGSVIWHDSLPEYSIGFGNLLFKKFNIEILLKLLGRN